MNDAKEPSCERIAGTEGYEKDSQRFIQLSQGLDFYEVCKDFVPFLPAKPAHVLDVGAGAGQNAAALADAGYQVTALEPMGEFLRAGEKAYSNRDIVWLQDSLPEMQSLGALEASFDFALLDGVWHHLNEAERVRAAQRLWQLLKQGGCCVISLRNGPAGMGTRIYPTDSAYTHLRFTQLGFKCELHLQNQASLFAYKPHVSWSRLVFRK